VVLARELGTSPSRNFRVVLTKGTYPFEAC
jgi:hypothetical protein